MHEKNCYVKLNQFDHTQREHMFSLIILYMMVSLFRAEIQSAGLNEAGLCVVAHLAGFKHHWAKFHWDQTHFILLPKT